MSYIFRSIYGLVSSYCYVYGCCFLSCLSCLFDYASIHYHPDQATRFCYLSWFLISYHLLLSYLEHKSSNFGLQWLFLLSPPLWFCLSPKRVNFFINIGFCRWSRDHHYSSCFAVLICVAFMGSLDWLVSRVKTLFLLFGILFIYTNKVHFSRFFYLDCDSLSSWQDVSSIWGYKFEWGCALSGFLDLSWSLEVLKFKYFPICAFNLPTKYKILSSSLP